MNLKFQKTAAIMSATLATMPVLAQKNNATPKLPSQPNVLIIYADDLGYGDLECYGAKNISTPNVNRDRKSTRLNSSHMA